MPCEPKPERPYLPVFINHFLTRPLENGALLKSLFVERQWSAEQIAEFSGWSKTSVIDALKLLGINRPPKARGSIPFGWKLQAGQLVPHVRQQKIVHRIVQLSARECKPTMIARLLNEKGVPTKNRKRWEHKTVRAILERARGTIPT